MGRSVIIPGGIETVIVAILGDAGVGSVIIPGGIETRYKGVREGNVRAVRDHPWRD